MERRTKKILNLLEAVQEKSTQSQRELARTLNLSLGLVNQLIKELISQGFLKTDNCKKNKVRYMLTSKGVAWQTDLKKQYLLHHIASYNEMKRVVEQELTQFMSLDESCCILFYGAGALCEIACMLSSQSGTSCDIKIIDDLKAGNSINGYKIYKEAQIKEMDYDAILIMGLEDTNLARNRLVGKGIPSNKIFQIISHRMQQPLQTYIEEIHR